MYQKSDLGARKTKMTPTFDLSLVKKGYSGSENLSSVDRLPVSFCIDKVTFEKKNAPKFDPG